MNEAIQPHDAPPPGPHMSWKVRNGVTVAHDALREAMDDHADMATALADALELLGRAPDDVRPGTVTTLAYALSQHLDAMRGAMLHAFEALDPLTWPRSELVPDDGEANGGAVPEGAP